MSTHKYLEKVCIFVTIFAVLVTVLFMNGSKIGIAADDSVTFSYEDKIFDDSYVHTIDIEIDDWEGFIETATDEEYTTVNVTIDGETISNVGLRAKGNTSLSTVSQLGSERYSLKIEFDAFQDSTNYYGLDKLCLNNLIQDYTMMKDYITYKLMNEFGVASPLVSYVYVTVNGEDWGLYLAVEAVEDSFLERNYGKNYGDLYKPDTMSMGGGRGNGGDFDMKDMDFDKMGITNPFENSDDGEDSDSESDKSGPPDFGGSGMGSDDAKIKYSDDDTDSYSTIFNSAKTTVTNKDKKRLISAIKTLNEGIENEDAQEIAEAVDVDALMRYMVVHNFVVNGDSYTGSMIHNYYLYEEDGLMTFIPWDYNLAFGTFQANDADAAVNDPIDNPLSITDGDTDRPMFDWIITCDEYTEMYHEYFQDFLEQFYENGYLENLVTTTYEMIYEYVEKDPTKFCEVSEFETAVETMKTFLELRCQSISGQLDGTIGSTDAEQSENPDALIDASSITLSDLGSMGGGMGGGPGGNSDEKGGFPGGGSDSDSSHSGHGGPGRSHSKGSSDSEADSSDNTESSATENTTEGSFTMPDNMGDVPDFNPGEMGDFEGFGNASSISFTNYIYLGGCILALMAAIIFALKYRGRR